MSSTIVTRKIAQENAAGWRAGEEIVLASTDFDPRQAERRTISAIRANTITLDKKLDYMHFGKITYLHFINNAEESGIVNVWQRMNSGRLKVFPSLSKYLEERRLYRRDEKEEIVRDRDNLQDAVRCLVNGISSMRTKPVKLEPAWPEYGGSSGWME